MDKSAFTIACFERLLKEEPSENIKHHAYILAFHCSVQIAIMYLKTVQRKRRPVYVMLMGHLPQ